MTLRVTADAEGIDRILAAALAAADAAGVVIRRYFRATVAETKADDSPVTIADREAELAIRAVLERHFPRCAILGEEFGGELDAENCWVIDPIDGTRAFITGRPIFGCLIGFMHRGRPLLGVLDQPISGERWIGVHGQPTRFEGRFGAGLSTRRLDSLSEAELSCTAPEMVQSRSSGFARLSRHVRRTSWGGDCYAYGLLALGQIDVIAEGGLKPWDWVPLVPIVEGAGGSISDWSGAPLRLDGDGHVLALGDRNLLGEVSELLMT